MKYEHGKAFTSEIEQSKQLPPFDYPIPDERTNQYMLDRLNTKTFEREERQQKQVVEG